MHQLVNSIRTILYRSTFYHQINHNIPSRISEFGLYFIGVEILICLIS